MSDKGMLIMEAALKVFSKQGYSKTKISEIVSEAGIAQGTFYLYFKNKKDVFTQLIDEFLGIMYERMSSITIDGTESYQDMENQIKQIYRVLLTTYKENRMLAKIFFREAIAIDEEFENKVHEFYRRCTDYASKFLDIGIQAGLLREFNKEILIYAVIGMVENVAYKFIVIEDYDDIEALVENMAKFESYGIIKRETY